MDICAVSELTSILDQGLPYHYAKVRRAFRASCVELDRYLGQTVNGYLLNIDTTPVGVGLVIEAVVDVVDVAERSESAEFNEGQHSGRSSEQPINGTSIDPPSGKVRMVN